jgi:hypothetical protein
MKKGKSIVELAQELTRVKDTKRDFVVPTERLEAVVSETSLGGNNVNLKFDHNGIQNFGLNPWSSNQPDHRAVRR